MKVKTMGTIARFNMVDSRLFHSVVAERISDALRRAIRQTTVTMLISDNPGVVKVLISEDVVLIVLLTIVDNNCVSSRPSYLLYR